MRLKKQFKETMTGGVCLQDLVLKSNNLKSFGYKTRKNIVHAYF